MKDLIQGFLSNHTAASAPCEHIANQVMLDGRWSDLDCPSKTQVKNFVQSYFSQKKKAAQHALSRRGKRDYTGFAFKWLKDEVEHRGMHVGRNKTAGCIRMLEQHDDDHEEKLTKFHSTPIYESESDSTTDLLSMAEFKKSIENPRRDVPSQEFIPFLEWYTKECAYQQLETDRHVREKGMLKLLHNHYIKQKGNVKRHDGDHVVDGEPAYKVDDKVQVLWKGKWYPAVVIKCYRNHTWDVQYPPESDQVFCKRLPESLLKMNIV